MAGLNRRSVLLGSAGLALASRAKAAGYPDRPVRIIVPFAPAGPTDIMARIMAAHLGERLGGSFIVENRAGAGGNIGANVVAHADPDGYTLLVASSALVANPSLYKRVPFDVYTDFAPIAELGTSPNVFIADPKSGIKTIADLVARAKADPNALSYGSPGIGSTPHLSGEMLKIDAGIKVTHVPFSGAGPAVQAVLSSTTQLACVALSPAHPLIVSGALNGLGITWGERWFDLPDVQTMPEAGYKDLVTDTFQGFLAPAKTPPAIVDALAQASLAILNDKTVNAQLQADGFIVLANGPDGLRKRIETEVPKWRDIIAKAGITAV